MQTNQQDRNLDPNKQVHHAPTELFRKKRFEKPIVIRLTREERELVHAQATFANLSVNGFVREKLGFDTSNATKRRKRRSDASKDDRSRTNG